ncbi:phosphatase PAP2 family protein [Actinoplanes sp. NPDC051346]|uniref:phosphatase PAP2 family protein n=1 Tax=Actinoplanes sp. NPDC051346 TaxID=3155048 RepID=UPI00343F3BD9
MSRRGWREIVLLLGAFAMYSAARMLADPDLASARATAGALLDVEHLVRLDLEGVLNRAVTGTPWLAAAMSFWYAALHYLVTPLVLVWLYRRHPDRYPVARNGLIIGSALGLVGYVLLPTAPPRLMPTGFVDTLASTADLGWWSSHASAPAGLGHFTNELAAMPSLHVGWAFWVAWALPGLLPRVLGGLYAAITAVVVVGTANHWVLDAIAGVAVITIGMLIAARRRRGVRTAEKREVVTAAIPRQATTGPDDEGGIVRPAEPVGVRL